MEEDQIILIDKPADISSFGVVAKVRGYLRNKFGHKVKVGHTGTLDPFATGLLILLTGKNTKKSADFLKLDKVYEATLKLGSVSTTGDPEGQIRTFLVEDISEPGKARIRAFSPVATGENDPCPEKYVMTLQSNISAVFPIVNDIFIISNLAFFGKMCYNSKVNQLDQRWKKA